MITFLIKWVENPIRKGIFIKALEDSRVKEAFQ